MDFYCFWSDQQGRLSIGAPVLVFMTCLAVTGHGTVACRLNFFPQGDHGVAFCTVLILVFSAKWKIADERVIVVKLGGRESLLRVAIGALSWRLEESELTVVRVSMARGTFF